MFNFVVIFFSMVHFVVYFCIMFCASVFILVVVFSKCIYGNIFFVYSMLYLSGVV